MRALPPAGFVMANSGKGPEGLDTAARAMAAEAAIRHREQQRQERGAGRESQRQAAASLINQVDAP